MTHTLCTEGVTETNYLCSLVIYVKFSILYEMSNDNKNLGNGNFKQIYSLNRPFTTHVLPRQQLPLPPPFPLPMGLMMIVKVTPSPMGATILR